MSHPDAEHREDLAAERAECDLRDARYELATRLSPVVTAAIRRAVTAHTERPVTLTDRTVA